MKPTQLNAHTNIYGTILKTLNLFAGLILAAYKAIRTAKQNRKTQSL
jgi:hypothetical protein